MNTEISITVYSAEEKKTVNELISEAFQQFDYIVRKYSRFSPTSELSIVNSLTTNPRIIDKEFYEIAKYCIDMYHKTNGIFDFTVIDLLEAIGYKHSYKSGKIDEPKSIEEIKDLINNRPSVDEIKLTEIPEYTISLAPNQRIEFGGCLKGYSADLAFEKLLPLENFLIDAGGDIRVSGKKYLDGKFVNWNAGLWNGENEIKEYISLNSGDTITCSGSAARKFANLHHLINPQKIDFEKNYSHCFVYINSNEYLSNTKSISMQRLPLNSDSTNSFVGIAGDSALVPNFIGKGAGGGAQTSSESNITANNHLCMLADTFATVAFIMGEEEVKKILPKGYYIKYY